MKIGKIDRQVLKIMNSAAKITSKVEVGAKERKYMQDACYKFSEVTGKPLTEVQKLTIDATPDQFTFLRTMVNKFNYKKLHSIKDQSEHIFNIYSMVEKPSAQHLNIVRKTNDSFESIEKIFSLAKDKEALEFVENLQYGELRNSKNQSKIIIDLLSSKNRDRYIANPERYSSFLETNADKENAVEMLDNLINTGKFKKNSFDAKLAVKNLFKKQKIEVAMAGKAEELEKSYSKSGVRFLKSLIKNFAPARKSPKEETKSVVVKMYETTNAENSKLRTAIVERFKSTPLNTIAAEVAQMQTLFEKIDNNNDAKIFVKKAILKDLKIDSIEELNEILDIVPLKKANIFFNNAKRIIEKAGREERKTALITELENPFYEPKFPHQAKAKLVRMFDKPETDNFFTRTYKILENKYNQYRYSRMAA